MTGAESLQLFMELVADGNELFLSDEDFVVINGVTKPTLKKIYADFLASTGTYPTVAEGLAATSGSGTNNRFFTVPGTGGTFETRYRNDAGVAVAVGRLSSAEVVEKLSRMTMAYDGATPEQLIYALTNQEGEVVVEQTTQAYRTLNYTITSKNGVTTIGDVEGNALLHADKEGMIVGMMVQIYSDTPGWLICNLEGEVLADLSGENGEASAEDPLGSGLLFSPLLVTAQGYEQRIYTQNLLTKRQLAGKVVTSLASTSTSKTETGSPIRLPASTFGNTAILNVRGTDAPSARKFMSVQVRNLPVQSPAVPVKILLLGDSILNRQGGTLLKQVLVALGFAPTFIGTMRGSASATDAGAITGELGEAREGWETGDYTNAITDRALILPPGQESAYLAMSKLEQRDRNVFARAATGSDPAGIIRNGYVFDPAFYQSRFGLDTPDIVVNDLGTNNVRDRTAAEIYDGLLSDDTIMHGQIRAAWPNAKVIRFIPGTAINNERNALWTSHYAQAIRAIQQSAADRADSKVVIAPVWALTNPEAGYAYESSTVGADGFASGDWSDAIHPIQASRLALFEALAPYVGAAAAGII